MRPSPPTPEPIEPLLGSPGASLWAFARAVVSDSDAARIALRAAFADAWPPSRAAAEPADAADRIRLLVALGRSTALLTDPEAHPAGDHADPFARAFRSLPWPQQVTIWGRAVDGIDGGLLAAALGPDAGPTADVARRLLLAYLRELARTAAPACAQALRRAEARVEAGDPHEVAHLDAHIGTCPTCSAAFPLHVASALCLVAAPDDAIPPDLAHQILLDHDRTCAGLALTVDGPAGDKQPGRAGAALLIAGVAAAVVAVLASFSGGPRGQLTAAADTAVTSPQRPSQSGSVASPAVTQTIPPVSTPARTAIAAPAGPPPTAPATTPFRPRARPRTVVASPLTFANPPAPTPPTSSAPTVRRWSAPGGLPWVIASPSVVTTTTTTPSTTTTTGP